MSEFNWLWLVLALYAPLTLLALWGLGVLISIIETIWPPPRPWYTTTESEVLLRALSKFWEEHGVWPSVETKLDGEIILVPPRPIDDD